LEFAGSATSAEAKEKLVPVKGQGNFYPNSNLIWRIVPRGSAETPIEFTFDQRDEKWWVERGTQRAVMWKQYPAPNQPVHQLTKADYLLSDHPSNPAIRSAEGHRVAGFDIDQLPAIPEVRKKPVEPPVPLGPNPARED
jgi:hypothetical protein